MQKISFSFYLAVLVITTAFGTSPLVSTTQAQTKIKAQALSLSNAEFTNLLIRSLEDDQNGMLLLSVSDSFTANINAETLSLSAVINLNKLEKISLEARQNIERFDSFFFFLDGENLNLTVIGEPVVRNGLVGIKDNFSVKIGPLPLSNGALRQFGIQVERANTTNLKLKDIVAQSIELKEGSITVNTINAEQQKP